MATTGTDGQKPSSVATLRQVAPSVEAAFQQLRTAIENESALDRKTRELIVLAGYVTARQEKGFKTHARRALDFGASAAELRTAVVVTLGATATVEAVGTALQWLEEIIPAAQPQAP